LTDVSAQEAGNPVQDVIRRIMRAPRQVPRRSHFQRTQERHCHRSGLERSQAGKRSPLRRGGGFGGEWQYRFACLRPWTSAWVKIYFHTAWELHLLAGILDVEDH
jgi:hypothetical protein